MKDFPFKNLQAVFSRFCLDFFRRSKKQIHLEIGLNTVTALKITHFCKILFLRNKNNTILMSIKYTLESSPKFILPLKNRISNYLSQTLININL
jgi:hypothetical protein